MADSGESPHKEAGEGREENNTPSTEENPESEEKLHNQGESVPASPGASTELLLPDSSLQPLSGGKTPPKSASPPKKSPARTVEKTPPSSQPDKLPAKASGGQEPFDSKLGQKKSASLHQDASPKDVSAPCSQPLPPSPFVLSLGTSRTDSSSEMPLPDPQESAVSPACTEEAPLFEKEQSPSRAQQGDSSSEAPGETVNIQEESDFSTLEAEPTEENMEDLMVQGREIFMNALVKLIVQGEGPMLENTEKAIGLVDLLKENDRLFYIYETKIRGDRIVHWIVEYHSTFDLLNIVLTKCPELSRSVRTDTCAGQTILHTLVAQGKKDMVQALFEHPSVDKSTREFLIHARATGSRFTGTVYMGETALSVAALSFDIPMVAVLLKAGASISDTNSKDETTLHTLVRYGSLYPMEQHRVRQMLQDLHQELLAPIENGQVYCRRVWYAMNKEKMTALHLAAFLGEKSLFSSIMNLRYVYCHQRDEDNAHDLEAFDISEIDTCAKRMWKKTQRVTPVFESTLERLKWRLQEKRRLRSVADDVCDLDLSQACRMMDTDVFKDLVSCKWRAFRGAFCAFFFVFLIFHGLLLAFTALNMKTDYRANEEKHSETALFYCHIYFWVRGVLGSLAILFALWNFLVRCDKWKLSAIHHNGIYSVLLILYGVCVAGDSFWFDTDDEHNNKVFLVGVILTGFWMFSFFLRPFAPFCQFITFMNKVLFRDFPHFFFIFLTLIFTFGTAFHVTHNSMKVDVESNTRHSVHPDWRELHISLLSTTRLLFNQTLVIPDNLKAEWLSLVVYYLYIIMIVILLFYAFTRVHTTYTEIFDCDHVILCRLQTLSVLLLLEKLIPFNLDLRQAKNYAHLTENMSPDARVVLLTRGHVNKDVVSQLRRSMGETGIRLKEYTAALQTALKDRTRPGMPRNEMTLTGMLQDLLEQNKMQAVSIYQAPKGGYMTADGTWCANSNLSSKFFDRFTFQYPRDSISLLCVLRIRRKNVGDILSPRPKNTEHLQRLLMDGDEAEHGYDNPGVKHELEIVHSRIVDDGRQNAGDRPVAKPSTRARRQWEYTEASQDHAGTRSKRHTDASSSHSGSPNSPVRSPEFTRSLLRKEVKGSKSSPPQMESFLNRLGSDESGSAKPEGTDVQHSSTDVAFLTHSRAAGKGKKEDSDLDSRLRKEKPRRASDQPSTCTIEEGSLLDPLIESRSSSESASGSPQALLSKAESWTANESGREDDSLLSPIKSRRRRRRTSHSESQDTEETEMQDLNQRVV